MLADSVRQRLHPEGLVTYIIDRNINYTNVCVAQCAFCAFYRDLPSKEGYLLTKEQLAAKIEETLALGGNQILLQGGLHPDLGIEFYEELFRWIKGTYPIWIHGLSPAEVKHIARVSSLTTEETLRRLVGARARLDPRRRGRGAVRPRAQHHRHRQGHDRRLDRGHGDRAPASASRPPPP